ncbi:MAG: sugar phosphate isomerase/epimerase [Opitutaceae bacterium]
MKATLVSGEYPWQVALRPQGIKLIDNLDVVFHALTNAGIDGWEGFVPDEKEAGTLSTLLAKHSLSMPSAYANLRLHEPDSDRVIAETIASIPRLRKLGVRFLEVNPEPIAWGSPLDKDDAQLRRQAINLQALGIQLLAGEIELCYHTHDPEMRQSAREFHHMLQATDPMVVGFNLDPHWIYRGCGNSQIALEDILDLYGDRIRTVHLRQSIGGIWSETLGEGDLDYEPIIDVLKAIDFDGVLVLEQAAEPGTPETMPMAERERLNAAWARKVFGL